MPTFEVTVSFSGYYTCFIEAKSLKKAEEKAEEMLQDGELDDENREYSMQQIEKIEEVRDV